MVRITVIVVLEVSEYDEDEYIEWALDDVIENNTDFVVHSVKVEGEE